MSSSLFTVDDFVHSRASSLDFNPAESPQMMTPLRAGSEDDNSWKPQKTSNFFGAGETGLGAYGDIASLALKGVAKRASPEKLGMISRTIHKLIGLPSLQHLSQVTPKYLIRRLGQLLFPYITHFRPGDRTPIPSVAFEPLTPTENGDLDYLSPEMDVFIPFMSMLLLRCLVCLNSSEMASLALGILPIRLLILLSSKFFGISGISSEGGGLGIGESIALLSTSAFHCCIGLIIANMKIGFIGKILIGYLGLSWAVFEVKLLRQRLVIAREREMIKLIFLFLYGVIEAALLCLWVWIL